MMKNFEIADGITVTARPRTMRMIALSGHIWMTKATRERIAKERATGDAEIAWLLNPANWDDPLYSDVYKDVHGVRPRW